MDYFITFPAVICTEDKTNHRYTIGHIIDMLIGMHEISRQLWQAGIANNSHYQKCRTALCLIPQSF